MFSKIRLLFLNLLCARFMIKRKMEERTERESDRRRQEEKWLTCWCCRDQQIACRMSQASAEKLEHTGPAEKKRVTSVPQREHWQERQSRLCEKEQSPLSKVPDRKLGENQGE